MARKQRRGSVLRRNHRTIGALAAVFVVLMVISGLLLNHSHGLGLDRRHVSQSFVLDWYGLGEPEHIRSFTFGDDWLSFAGSQLYFNDKNVATLSGATGAIASGDMLVAAGTGDLILLTRDGALLERQAWSVADAGSIESLGNLKDDTVVIETTRALWLADTQLLNWEPAGQMTESPVWSSPAQTPPALRRAIVQSYRGDSLSLERLLLDLHSGRVFGTVGVIVYDLLALALGFLAVSGLILWARGRRKGNRSA